MPAHNPSPTITIMKKNYYLTSDIRLSRDSQGCFSATHKFQGLLIDSNYYDSSKAARQAAVGVLKEKKEESSANA